MSGFDFREFQRIPAIDPANFPFRVEVHNSRHYTFWVDFTEFEHQRVLTEFLRVVILEDRRAQRACHDLLANAEVMSYIKEFHAKRAADRGFAPDYVDLFYVYAQIRTQRPRRVLEYGSGISTLVIALALEEIGEDGMLVSLEPCEEWALRTRDTFPQHLLKRAEIIYSSPFGFYQFSNTMVRWRGA